MLVIMKKAAGQAGESLAQFLPRGASITASWASGTDHVNLQVQTGADSYEDAKDSGGAAVQLTTAHPFHQILADANYRVTAGSGSDITVSVNY